MCLLDSRKKAAYDASLKAKASSPPVPPPPPPPPAIETQGIEGLLAEEQEELLQKAQQAYNDHNYERVVELLAGQMAKGDPRFQLLLEGSRLSLERIQRLSQELEFTWKQKDVKRLTQVANELLRIQPSHLAANEAIRWAGQVNRRFLESVLPLVPGGWKLKGEPLLRKYLALTALVLVAAFVFGSVLVYHQLATAKKQPESIGSNLPQPATVAAPEKQPKAVKPDNVTLAGQQEGLTSAIYNVEVDPYYAMLTIKDDKGVVTGLGKQRQIRIDHPPTSGGVLIEAVCSGYKSSEQWLKPKLGETVDLQIHLEKLQR